MRIAEPNYTQVPNILLDEWLSILGHAELKVLLFIVRKTIGYHKIRDKISLTQIQEATGLDRKNVVHAVNTLLDKNLISKLVEGQKGAQSTFYELVLCSPEIKENSPSGVKPPEPSGVKPLVENILSTEITPEIIQKNSPSGFTPPTKESTSYEVHKERKCKEKSEQVPPSANASHLIDFFISSLKRRDPAFKKANVNKWLQEMDRLLRIDERPVEEVELMILWTESDYKFWRSACMCPASLRRNYSKIKVQKDSSAVKDLIRKNRDYALQVKNKYPDKLKDLSFDDKFAINRTLGKEIPFMLPHEQFKQCFLSLFGGKHG